MLFFQSVPDSMKILAAKYLKAKNFHNNSVLLLFIFRVHTDRERSHLCNQCGSMYMEKTQLWAHIAYIHGKSVEDSMCFSCGKIIRTDVALQKHILDLHGKEVNRSTPSSDINKSYKCETCLEEFSDVSEIRKHFKDNHKEVKINKIGLTVNVKNDPRYPCRECDRTFYTKSSMEGHLNRIHIKERKYPCTRCPEVFIR